MSFAEGNYVIIPAFDTNINLVPGGLAPLVPILGLQGGPLIKWHFTPVNSTNLNLYAIAIADRPESKLIVKDDLLFASTKDAAVEFAIEPVEKGYRIRVFDKFDYWSLDVPNGPVRIAHAASEANVIWLIVPVP